MNRSTVQREAVGFPGDEDYDPGEYTDADTLLGPGVASATFPEIGASISGTILDVAASDQRDLEGKVRTFATGEVRRQVVLTLQTQLCDDDDDDGRRRLFVKGGMTKAFRAALQAVKAPGPRPGGKVKVTYAGDGEPPSKGLNPPKQFAVTYTPPKPTATSPSATR